MADLHYGILFCCRAYPDVQRHLTFYKSPQSTLNSDKVCYSNADFLVHIGERHTPIFIVSSYKDKIHVDN